LSLAAFLVLSGCGHKHPASSAPKPFGRAPSLDLSGTVAPSANDNNVIPFDVAVVRDKKTVAKIESMDAASWFGPKGRCTFRGGPKATVVFHSWEFVPGQTFRIQVELGKAYKGVIAFAGYDAPGNHSVTFTRSGSAVVQLNDGGLRALTDGSKVDDRLPRAEEKTKVCPDD